MEDKDTIDLIKVKDVFLTNWKRIATIVVVTTTLAISLSFVLPKEYESTVLVRAKAPKQGSGISLQAAAAVALLGGGVSTPSQTYIELLKSRSVLEPVIAQLDLPEEKKSKLEAKAFAKRYLKVTNTKGTDLIEITAIGKTPEEAQAIATNVVSAFQKTLTTMNQSEQSLMVRFLNERINVAKKDMETAEQNLEKFRQQEKLYVPDEQAKSVIKKITEFDQRLAQIQVENEMNQAKARGISDQLQKQNVAITTYKLADNDGIQQLRNAIIQKQISLIDLQQRFTDKHPNVILIKKEIEELNEKLKTEAINSVAAGTNTLNPVHASLLKDKAATETAIWAGQATLDALRKAQTENEKEISKLSAGSMSYLGFERQVRITQEVYSALVRNYEQSRIQEAMESMDIQVVDEANLSKRPSTPGKMMFMVFGFIVGSIIAGLYLVVQYMGFNKKRSLYA